MANDKNRLLGDPALKFQSSHQASDQGQDTQSQGQGHCKPEKSGLIAAGKGSYRSGNQGGSGSPQSLKKGYRLGLWNRGQGNGPAIP